MQIARLIGLAAVALIAVVVGVITVGAEGEETSQSTTYESVVGAALADYEANDALAESAPQQQVVNGWIARDLLEVIARQNVELIENQDSQLSATARTNSLLQGALVVLVLGVIAVAVLGISMAARRGNGDSGGASTPKPPGDTDESLASSATSL